MHMSLQTNLDSDALPLYKKRRFFSIKNIRYEKTTGSHYWGKR